MFPQLLLALKKNKLFNKIKDSDLNFHVSLENLLDRKAGEIIYKEGDPGNFVYAVIEGEVAIDKTRQLGTPGKLIVPVDDFFGEEDYLENMPCSSTAYALQDSTIVRLEREVLSPLITNNEQFFSNIRRTQDEFTAANEQAPDTYSNSPAAEENNFDIGFNDSMSDGGGMESLDFESSDNIDFTDIPDIDFKKTESARSEIPSEETNASIPVSAAVPGITPEMAAGQEAAGHETLEQAASKPDEMTAEHLRLIMQAAQLVNSNIKIDDLLQAIVDAARSLTTAERGTLYLFDKEKNELWSKIIEGDGISEIRLKMGEGIAGWTAENREIVNIKDVTADPRFKSSFDHSSGFITKNMLCFPISNKTDEVIGVLQLLNSARGEFSKLDEEFISMLSVHAALALENAEMVEKLLQTERVTSLGKMANFLIQDIKKPVLVSKRYAEHLKTKNLTNDVFQVIDMLLDQLNHVADLVQTTSSYSEGKTILHSVVCSLNETLDAVFDKLASNVRIRNSEIVKQYDKDATVKLDRKEFYQSCMHIIRNACDAMPEGGKILVTTKNKGNCVEISFKDNGLGIPDSIKDKIFEPFMSHGKAEGTGLGLSVTKKIIEDHGGTITVESDLGEGATFTISIPVSVGER